MQLDPNDHDGTEAAFSSVHNYYEKPVYAQVWRASEKAKTDSNFMADVLCVALNRLPPRYVRHEVDTTFYLSPTEQDEIADKVARAVADALAYVESRPARAP